MSLKKIERIVAIMKAQVLFLATQQKDKKSIHKNIMAYSKNVTESTSKCRTYENKPGNASRSKLTFQVYSHLADKKRDSVKKVILLDFSPDNIM